MLKDNITKAEMACRMHTNRAALDRLLDPGNLEVALQTLSRGERSRAVSSHRTGLLPYRFRNMLITLASSFDEVFGRSFGEVSSIALPRSQCSIVARTICVDVMDSDNIKTFLEVWRQKSFSRAGERLGITQPAVSAQIRALEREIGEPLFDRKGGKVTFTAAGRVFEPFAEKVIELQRHVVMMIAEQRRSPRGEISLSAQEATSLYVLPKIFADFQRQNPKVGLRIVRADRSRILEGLLNREVDFGVVSLPVNDNRFKVETIHKDQLLLAVPIGHPLSQVVNPGAKDLAKHRFLLPKQGRQRERLLNVFRMNDVHPKAIMEVDSNELMKRFVLAGMAVGFLPSVMIAEELKAGTIQVIPIDSIRFSRDLALVYMKDKTLTRAANAFVELSIAFRQSLD